MKITKADQKIDWYQRIEGDVEFAANLGDVNVAQIWCTGSLRAAAGTLIKAGAFIDAGGSINAGGYIKAGGSINAGTYIKAGTFINAGTYIKAGTFINAGTYIKAGGSINAGTYIKAGTFINAGKGVTAGYWIRCAKSLNVKWRIIAGVSPDHDGSNPDDSMITVGKLESGTVAFGELVETGLEATPLGGCQHAQTGKFCSECGEPLDQKGNDQ